MSALLGGSVGNKGTIVFMGLYRDHIPVFPTKHC